MKIDSIMLKFATGKHNVVLTLFDTAGMEQYQSMATSEIKQSDLCLLVYAVDTADSVRAIPALVEFVEKTNPNCKLILVGNKADLKSVDLSSLDAISSKFIKHIKCSAKTGEGVAEVLNIDYDCLNLEKTEMANTIVATETKKGGCC